MPVMPPMTSPSAPTKWLPFVITSSGATAYHFMGDLHFTLRAEPFTLAGAPAVDAPHGVPDGGGAARGHRRGRGPRLGLVDVSAARPGGAGERPGDGDGRSWPAPHGCPAGPGDRPGRARPGSRRPPGRGRGRRPDRHRPADRRRL